MLVMLFALLAFMCCGLEHFHSHVHLGCNCLSDVEDRAANDFSPSIVESDSVIEYTHSFDSSCQICQGTFNFLPIERIFIVNELVKNKRNIAEQNQFISCIHLTNKVRGPPISNC